MRIATHLAARALLADRLDKISDARLDAIHAAWVAEAPQPELSDCDRRHMADRRALARWHDAGRRTGDHGRQREDLRDCA